MTTVTYAELARQQIESLHQALNGVQLTPVGMLASTHLPKVHSWATQHRPMHAPSDADAADAANTAKQVAFWDEFQGTLDKLAQTASNNPGFLRRDFQTATATVKTYLDSVS
jgi:hypothetical protein